LKYEGGGRKKRGGIFTIFPPFGRRWGKKVVQDSKEKPFYLYMEKRQELAEGKEVGGKICTSLTSLLL